MRIIHLYDGHEQVYQGRGSVPNVVWNVARETAALGHDVTIIERQWAGLAGTATHDGVSFERLALSTGADEPWTRVPYEEVTSVYGLIRLVVDRTNFALKALRTLRNRDFDVLHVHLPFAANVLITLAPWLRRRTVFTAHLGELRLDMLADESRKNSDNIVPDSSGRSKPFVPGILSMFSPDIHLAKRTAYTTILNPTIKRAFANHGVAQERLEVVPNGVDFDRFGRVAKPRLEAVRNKYDLNEDPTVLFVGTIMPRKGVTELVRAVDTVVDTIADEPRVVIAGERSLDEAYTERVDRLMREQDLNPYVSMPGFVPAEDLPALYALADVFVIPSLEEGFGMTAVEAMAAGTPVVATRVGGLPRLIDDGAHGRLVDPGDVDGFADALANLLEERSTDRVSDRVRARAREYSWASIAARFVSVYEEVVR